MPSAASSLRSASATASIACFEAVYAPANGNASLPPDRADEDDSRPLGGAQRRQHRTGEGELADDVDLELLAQLVAGEQLERPREAETGVVDDSVEPAGPVIRCMALSIELSSASSSSIGCSSGEPSPSSSAKDS